MKEINELLDYGIIVIDKPTDWTSHDVVAYVRKALGIKKCGHLGTLDPMVTGVLPLVLGKATKLSVSLMKKDKTYIGTMHIHKEIDEKKLKEEMKKFEGKIKQLPPIKSRVKRQEREREVYEFKLLKYDKEKRNAEFIARVEAGTYIRKLIHDLGEKTGGAHMIGLRRTQAGIFDEKQAITIDEFKDIVDKWKNGNEENLRKIIIDPEDVLE